MSNDDIMGSAGATPASYSQLRQPSEQPRTATAVLLAEDERAWLLAEARELRPDDPGDTVPGRILERWETARSLTAARRYLAPLTQPRTPTGRALVSMPLHTAGIGSDRDDDRLLAAILAIEAEATPRVRDVEHNPVIIGAVAPDPVASPPEAVRLLRELVDRWFLYSDDLPRADVMDRLARLDAFHASADEARRYLATEGEAGT